jgi:hypothetical protein
MRTATSESGTDSGASFANVCYGGRTLRGHRLNDAIDRAPRGRELSVREGAGVGCKTSDQSTA